MIIEINNAVGFEALGKLRGRVECDHSPTLMSFERDVCFVQ